MKYFNACIHRCVPLFSHLIDEKYFDDKESILAFEKAMNDKGKDIKIEFVDW